MIFAMTVCVECPSIAACAMPHLGFEGSSDT